MQPYQEAGEATRRSGELPLDILKYAAGASLGTAGSMIAKKAISRMIPLLSDFVPESFAIKGLKNIDPRLGKFIDKTKEEGFDYNEIKDFLKSKIQNSEESNEKPKQNRNIIQQYSPELHEFILGEIQKGRSPLEAGAVASLNKTGNDKFRSVIKKIENDHKTPWSAIVETVYGGSGQAQSMGNTSQIQSNQQQQQSAQPQGQGQGQAALMAILQKLQQSRGI